MAKKSKQDNVDGEESRKDNIRWSEEMDVVLIDALLEQQVNGNRVDGMFTTLAYNNVLTICQDELKYPFDKDHLKNRIKTLKINFNTCHDLFNGLSGFGWSPITKMFEAEPEVWKNLIEAKPNAKKWRYTEIQFYDKLSELFAKDRAKGEAAASAKEKVRQWHRETSSNQSVGVEQFDEVTVDNVEPLSPQNNPEVTTASKSVKRKSSMIDSLDMHIQMLQSGMNNVADAIREGNAIAEKAQPRIYTDEEVYAELLNIGVPDDIQLNAFLFFIKSASNKRAFFAVPSHRRYELLLKMMDNNKDRN